MKIKNWAAALTIAFLVLFPGILWSWKISFLIAGILIILLVLIGNLLFNFALNNQFKINLFSDESGKDTADSKNLSDSSGSQKQESDASSLFISEKERHKKWFEKKRGEIWLQNKKDMFLHGYFLENKEGINKYAILVHGYNDRAEGMISFAAHFYDMGFHVLLPDLQAHGQSDGIYRGMGWLDRKDMLEWIDCILQRERDCEIVLFGISMGGATVMMTSGEDLAPQVKYIIEDCGYSSVWDEFAAQVENIFHLPVFPFLYFASLICKIRAGYFFKEASSVKQLKKCHLPVLFIHGGADDFVPFSMLDTVYSAANQPKQKLAVKDAIHAISSSTDSKLYWSTVQSFLQIKQESDT